jgi:hypothetical protein
MNYCCQEYKRPKMNISERAQERIREYQSDSRVQDSIQKAIDGVKGMTIDRLREQAVLEDLRQLASLKPGDLTTLSDKSKEMVNQLSHLANVQLIRVGEGTHDIAQHFKERARSTVDTAKQWVTGGSTATRPPDDLSEPLPGLRHYSPPPDLPQTHVVTGRRCPTKQAHHDLIQHQQALEYAKQFDARAVDISQHAKLDERPTLERQEQTASITGGATEEDRKQLKHSVSQPVASMADHMSDVAEKAKRKAAETGMYVPYCHFMCYLRS